MSTLETLQALGLGGVGVGSLLGGIGYAVRQGSIAMKRRADAEADRAAADRTEAEALTAMLSRYETRLTIAENEAREARAAALAATARVEACERRHVERERVHAEALATRDFRIAKLERAVRRLGDTPTGMQAVESVPPREKKQ